MSFIFFVDHCITKSMMFHQDSLVDQFSKITIHTTDTEEKIRFFQLFIDLISRPMTFLSHNYDISSITMYICHDFTTLKIADSNRNKTIYKENNTTYYKYAESSNANQCQNAADSFLCCNLLFQLYHDCIHSFCSKSFLLLTRASGNTIFSCFQFPIFSFVVCKTASSCLLPTFHPK